MHDGRDAAAEEVPERVCPEEPGAVEIIHAAVRDWETAEGEQDNQEE